MASNHGIDGGKAGLDRTLDVLDAVGLDHVGAFRSQEERDAHNGVLLKEINGIRIAFLDYTYGTNGIPIYNYPYALNVYTEDYMSWCSVIREDMLAQDMAYARSLAPDLIAVIVHWGAEYISVRQPAQTKLAEYLFSLGADLVLGHHSHRINPIECYKDRYIVYSLANCSFAGNNKPSDMFTFIFQVRFRIKNGEITANPFRIIPCRISSRTDYNDFAITPLTNQSNIKTVVDMMTNRSNIKNLEYAVTSLPLEWEN